MSSRSEELITQRLRGIFDQYESNEETKEFYEEVFADLKEATLDHLVQGETPEEAVAAVFADMGDLSEPLSQMAAVKEEAVDDIPYQEADQGWSWDSQQDFTSNAQSFAKGLKNVAKDIQKNVQPLADDMLGIMDDLMAEPIFAKDRIQNAEMLAAAWWRLQDDQELFQTRYDIPQNFIDTLIISKNAGSVALFASEDSEFHVIESINREEAAFGGFEEKGNQLVFHEGERPRFQWQFKSFLTVYVPKSFHGQLQLTVPSGRTWLGGLSQLDQVTIEASSGSVMLRDQGFNSLQVTTTSGSFDGAGLTGKDLTAKASSGSIKISNSQVDKMACQASSGSLRMKELTFTKGNFDTNSGSLRLKHCQGKKVWGNAKNGGVRAVQCVFEQYRLESKNGSVGFDGLQGGGEMSSKNGGIKGRGLLMTGDLAVDSHNGTIRLGVANEDFGFNLQTKNGQLRVDREVRMKISSAKQAVGEVGDHDRPKLSAVSKNGSIYVN